MFENVGASLVPLWLFSASELPRVTALLLFGMPLVKFMGWREGGGSGYKLILLSELSSKGRGPVQ